MPTKKKQSEPPWQVILEEIRSQNRATIEAVEVNREVLERRADQLEGRADGIERRQGQLEGTLTARMNGLEKGLTSRMDGLEKGLTGRMDGLEKGLTGRMDDLEKGLTGRMDALEKALGRVDQESRSRDASLEVAIRELKVSVQQNSVDLRDLGAKMEALTRLEERVAALERRSA